MRSRLYVRSGNYPQRHLVREGEEGGGVGGNVPLQRVQVAVAVDEAVELATGPRGRLAVFHDDGRGGFLDVGGGSVCLR